ncbi:glutathione S-transferase family protein [Alteromonas sp. NFXS44]|uniref:glutathione S-transferase family protein n=1 Tax=Alteromonas sp. NFXS44 TaxID=2818435 RepID=UPI0032DE8A47
MIILYHSDKSTCSQRVRHALAEKHISWESRHIKLDANEHLSTEYLALNPNGLVPTLIDGSTTVVDSSVILEYLEDVYPEQPLRPSLAADKAQMRAWVQYLDEVTTPAIRYPSFQKAFGKRLATMPAEKRLAMARERPLREGFYRQLGPEGFHEGVLALAERQLVQSLDRIEHTLNMNRCLVGDELSIADISLLPSLVRLEDLHMQYLFEARPSVVRWYRDMCDRPSFELAYYPASRVNL